MMENLIKVEPGEVVIGKKIFKTDCAITDDQGTCLMYGELSTMQKDYEAGRQNWNLTSALVHQSANNLLIHQD